MKKILLALPILFCAFILAGCGAVVTTSVNFNADDTVTQVIEVVTDNTVTNNAMEAINAELINGDFFDLTDVDTPEDFGMSHDTDGWRQVGNYWHLRLILNFDNHASFLWWNDMDAAAQTAPYVQERETTLFFHRITHTWANPYFNFFTKEGSRTAAILDFFAEHELFSGTRNDITFYYVFRSSMRRSSVPDATRYHRDLATGNWYYFFQMCQDNPLTEIVIFDRRPNTPAWYGLAAILTAVFMGGLWLIFRSRKTNPLAPKDNQ